MRKPTFRATPRGRRPGEWQQITVSVPGRCGTVYTAPRDVFPILHCESSSGQPRGTRTACVLLLAAGAERAFFNSQPSILYKDTLGGDTRRMCDASGWSWRWPSVVSRSTRSAESRGEARRAATLESRRDSRVAARPLSPGLDTSTPNLDTDSTPRHPMPTRPTRHPSTPLDTI